MKAAGHLSGDEDDIDFLFRTYIAAAVAFATMCTTLCRVGQISEIICRWLEQQRASSGEKAAALMVKSPELKRTAASES